MCMWLTQQIDIYIYIRCIYIYIYLSWRILYLILKQCTCAILDNMCCSVSGLEGKWNWSWLWSGWQGKARQRSILYFGLGLPNLAAWQSHCKNQLQWSWMYVALHQGRWHTRGIWAAASAAVACGVSRGPKWAQISLETRRFQIALGPADLKMTPFHVDPTFALAWKISSNAIKPLNERLKPKNWWAFILHHQCLSPLIHLENSVWLVLDVAHCTFELRLKAQSAS